MKRGNKRRRVVGKEEERKEGGRGEYFKFNILRTSLMNSLISYKNQETHHNTKFRSVSESPTPLPIIVSVCRVGYEFSKFHSQDLKSGILWLGGERKEIN